MDENFLTLQELQSMNRCQMYLKATFLSDICNSQGTAIDQQMWDSQVQCNSLYQWPRTEKPPMTEWQEWRQTLTLALSSGKNGLLALPLGKWRSTKSQENGYSLEPEDNHLLEYRDNQWFQYARALGRCCTLIYHCTP